jgi:hypothetical protein
MPAGKYLMLISAAAVLFVLGAAESVLAESRTGQSNAIILQNQGAANPSNRAIILQNNSKNAKQNKATVGPKQLPPDPCKGQTVCN